MRLRFLGANRQVTGSRHCLETGQATVLVDCGMFQERDWLDRNWEPSPVPAERISALVLTHAHLDHCGLIPRLVHQGYRGPIFCTPASAELTELILRDAAEIQMEDAAFKKKRHRREGRRGKHPEVPLFTPGDVERALPLFERVPYEQPATAAGGLRLSFHDAGHILGSAIVELEVRSDGRPRRVLFSGDLGQRDKPILRDPVLLEQADFLVMESTYGNRDHPGRGDAESQLAEAIRRTAQRGGNLVIPTFAVERAQELMYHISRLMEAEAIPRLPVFLDSPMAVEATAIFERHRDCYDDQAWQLIQSGRQPLRFPGLSLVRTVEQSKQINHLRQPAIIMASSGMCTHGRIKHHLVHNIARPDCTILFTGYQARGTLGRQILDGNPQVRIHGRYWPVRAQIEELHGLSGHADRGGMLRWLRAFTRPPEHVFLTHGEPESSLAFAEQLRRELGWQASVPQYQDLVELDAEGGSRP
ncbi:MAG: MBL fold metallo-hydrolase RNA specificity domain-containing protein [Thermoguttaceae bacterium]